MKFPLTRSLACLALVPLVLLHAEESSRLRTDVDTLVSQLGSEGFEERETALTSLLGIGLPAVEPLKKALETHKEPEFVERAKRVLRVYEGGGEPVHGLMLRLNTSQKTITPGGVLKYSITLANQTDEPLQVKVGGKCDSKIHNELELAAGLSSHFWIDDWSRMGSRALRVKPRLDFPPFDRETILEDFFSIVPARDTLTFQAAPRFEIGAQAVGHYRLGIADAYALDAPARGIHRLQVEFFNPEDGATMKRDAKPRRWSGAVASNPIEVLVLETKK